GRFTETQFDIPFRPGAAIRTFAIGTGIASTPLAISINQEYDCHHMKKVATKSKEATHDRIVDAASRAIRRSGYNGAGVADIMKDAGLTHGGFYAHFASREAMLAEAADRAGSEAVAMMERIAATTPPHETLRAMMEAYLSKAHVESVETG